MDITFGCVSLGNTQVKIMKYLPISKGIKHYDSVMTKTG